MDLFIMERYSKRSVASLLQSCRSGLLFSKRGPVSMACKLSEMSKIESRLMIHFFPDLIRQIPISDNQILIKLLHTLYTKDHRGHSFIIERPG